ncbi:MAG TPA: serine/threonine-protein kinase, partial [Gammaproteobacteria bacterium]
IGSGAFGEVLLVEDRVVHEPIILKFLHRHLTGDPEVISRFVQEMRVTRRITHENVIRIHDFLTFGRSFAIAMEYFDSSALGQRLRQAPPTRAQALGYLRAVCRGMAAAHAVGVVHRDLKPGNVLIDDAGLVKVVDFGLAAATGQMTTRMTRAGVVLGTPQYMAPEQIRGQAVDARTDIYSLGVMMYELFTGVPPYTGTEPMAIMFQHIEGKPVPPCERVPELPSGFEQVILRAMALNPEDRFQSMRDVEQALAALPPEGG